MCAQNPVYYQVAQKIIAFTAESKHVSFRLHPSHLPFCIAAPPSPDLTIRVHTGTKPVQAQKPVFSGIDFTSEHGEKLWDIFRESGNIVVRSQTADTAMPLSLYLKFGEKTWDLYLHTPARTQPFDPLSYPLAPLIFYYFFTQNHSVLLHASGVKTTHKAFVFSGVSGVGKSTMARLWKHAGHTVVNDDRLVLQPQNGTVFFHNSPMAYYDVPKQAKLSAIFLLKQAQTNSAARLSGAHAISRLMAFCIQHHFDGALINQTLNTLSEIVSNVPVYELNFVNNPTCIQFILDSDFN